MHDRGLTPAHPPSERFQNLKPQQHCELADLVEKDRSMVSGLGQTQLRAACCG
jgi:hypothetical protein